MKFVILFTLVASVYCSGKNIRIVSSRTGMGLTGASSFCKVSISNRNTNENLELECNMYGYGRISCSTESKDSSFRNYDARIMECTNDGWAMYAKVAVYDKVGKYLAIKEFRDTDTPSCEGESRIKVCQSNYLVDEYWAEA